MKNRLLLFVFMFSIMLGMQSCSQKKNNFLNRFFHNTNARWNGYFKASEAYKLGKEKIKTGHKENYRKLLPLYIYGDDEMASAVQTDMDVVIKKCSRVIEYHSMDIKGMEYVKWIDDCWMLIGRAYFYEKNFKECIPIFRYVTKKFKGEQKYQASLWLIKSHIQTENYDQAEALIRLLANDNKIPEDILPEIKATIAEYYLTQDEYTKAMLELEEAVLIQKDKDITTRWMFILAQLYAEQGESISANNTYKAIAKRHPDYEMGFWAQMNRALAYNVEDGSSYDIKKVLLKMLRDDKNIEYRDKLYYALSKIYYQEGSEERQINALILSAKSSVDDNYQKGLSYLELAEIHFARPEYIPAQAFYDSAVQYIPDDFPNREEIVNIKNSLTELVENILIIQREDSLLALSEMPEDELDAFIDNLIEQRIADEEARREAAENQSESFDDSGFQNEVSNEKGAWYFYNDKTISLGKQEFAKQWGNRPNDDNWRRGDKSSISLDELDTFNELAVDSVLSGLSDKSKYLKDIPFSPEAKSKANENIVEAYYSLGIIYKEKMDDKKHAISAFRNLISRYDTSKYQINCLYQLYRMYLNDNRIDSSNYYKNYILSKYPYSDYAKIINDPDYAKHMDSKKKTAFQAYKKAYYYYTRGFYSACIQECDKAAIKIPDNHLTTKFKYLKALSAVSIKDKKDLIASLKKFKTENAGTSEAKDAEERIKILKSEKKIEAKDLPPPDYRFDKNGRHLAVMLLPAEGTEIEKIKERIDNYNKAYHGALKLSISAVLLNKETHMLSIKQFENSKIALSYFSDFSKNRTSLKKINNLENDFFMISYTNYALFFQDKRVESYLEFHQKNYEL